MKYIADHDFHVHTTVSACCHDENQTPENLLKYALENGFHKVCITNHLWDEGVPSEAEWHPAHTVERLKSVLPLPTHEGARLLFGAETDIDYNGVLGISRKTLDEMDFVTVATTHLHLGGNTVREKPKTPEEAAELWLQKIRILLRMDLPFHKMGIAHLTCGHIMKGRSHEVIRLLQDEDLYEIFQACSKKGVGIELNVKTLDMTDEVRQVLMHPYHIAKDCGCKFYLGSDAHKGAALETVKAEFENVIDILDLQETDKFPLAKQG
ncbi:MAG: PHP domain-containing protein [Clostridia bacterium]|nr:PHP domain-containing protein [Clostridia bacterium]